MFYAKSDPIQSIKKHTDELLKRLVTLKKMYGDSILENIDINKENFWNTLEYACKYHDFGKVYTPFQNLILKAINMPQIKTDLSYEVIKHEQLSPLFIPYDINIPREYVIILYQAIFFHHNRYNITIDEGYKTYIENIITNDILLQLDIIKEELGFEINEELNGEYFDKVKYRNRIFEHIGQNKKLYLPYILIKGLLNRLDYSASSGYEIEENAIESIFDCTNHFFRDIIECKPNELQEFCISNSNNNILVIGSTGIGKTEASIFWSKDSKTFFTLPLVVSINAIYDRIKNKMRYKNVGLLHGNSLEYIEEKEQENSYRTYEQAKELSNKLTICTIDQIFTFVFKFNGYERIYATLSYSKIIIDEIQAYSPNIVAVILKGIEMINKAGGKFMIMTATLPTIYKDYLVEKNIDFKEGTYIKNIRRHRVKSLDKDILEDVDTICKNGKDSKVLVIVNTVNRAIEVYEKIKEITENVTLLHARFMQKDKSTLEQKIKEFSDDKESSGIWVTTQIVEASLDISFHYLYTELSTLDSLFQRMGRCYRSEEYRLQEPNILVYLNNVSGIGKRSVYDDEIHKKSRSMIENYNSEFLLEEEKIEMVKNLYSKESLKGSMFLNEFNKSIESIEKLESDDISKTQAEQMLRNIQSIRVIPREIYDTISILFEQYSKEKNNKEKNKIKRKIEKYSVNVKTSLLHGNYAKAPNIDDIYITNLKYSIDVGLIINKESKKLEIEDRMY